MKSRHPPNRAWSLLPLLLSLMACNIIGPEVEAEGTVGYSEIEGGCWSITTRTDNFHPINLAEELKVDGVRVRFRADRVKHLNTFCPGKVIEIQEIRRVN